MPYLEGRGRLIAPDLIGMGDSDKLENSGPDRYGYFEQRDYLFDLLDKLGVRAGVTLVLHDWGSALGFDWARQHPETIKGIVFMEAITAPMDQWKQFPAGFHAMFQTFRSDAAEAMILSDNAFVEQVLPGAIIRSLEEDELAEYRRPFLHAGEDRRPTLSWPRHLPIAGEPAAIVALVNDYAEWLATSSFSKLFINAEPGGLLIGELREDVRRWPNLTELTVSGIHFIQEDSPDEIGRAIAHWHRNI